MQAFCRREYFLAGRATLKQIAAQSGVSFQTVSKVLNHKARVSKETDERIRRAARELGYRPNYSARNLRLQRSGQLGYSWRPPPPDQANPILDEFLRSLLRSAEAAGYHILCFSYQEGEQQPGVEPRPDRLDGRVAICVDPGGAPFGVLALPKEPR